MTRLVLFLLVVVVATYQVQAWHIHFSSGVSPNNFGFDDPSFTVGFWTGFGSVSQPQQDADLVDVGQSLAYSVPCSETQLISNLQTRYEFEIVNDPQGSLIFETRIRMSNSTVLAYVDTPVVTYTTVTESHGGYSQYFAEQSASDATVVCPAGSLLVLETRISCVGCTPGIGIVLFNTFLSASVQVTQVQRLGFSSGLIPLASAANSPLLLGFSSFSDSNDVLTTHGFSWLCTANQTFYSLHTSVATNQSLAWNVTVVHLHGASNVVVSDLQTHGVVEALDRSIVKQEDDKTLTCLSGDAIAIRVELAPLQQDVFDASSRASVATVLLFY